MAIFNKQRMERTSWVQLDFMDCGNMCGCLASLSASPVTWRSFNISWDHAMMLPTDRGVTWSLFCHGWSGTGRTCGSCMRSAMQSHRNLVEAHCSDASTVLDQWRRYPAAWIWFMMYLASLWMGNPATCSITKTLGRSILAIPMASENRRPRSSPRPCSAPAFDHGGHGGLMTRTSGLQ